MPNLTIYLLRDEYKNAHSAVDGLCDEFPVSDDETSFGRLFVKDLPAKNASWVGLFNDYTLGLNATVKSTAALYVTEAGGRLFAIAFRHGRHLMKAGAYEDRFGLLVVINALKSDQLRSVDKRTFDTVDQNVRSQVSQQSAATEFGIDIERDLIRGITGIPTDSSIGLRMTGADSLVVSIDIDVRDLKPLLETYLAAFKSDAYKTDFNWIDQINQVSDSNPIRDVLDSKLLAAVEDARNNSGSSPNLWLAIPDIVDYAGAHRFRFTGASVSHNDLHMPGFISSLDSDEALDINILKQKQAFVVDDEGHPVGEKWSIFKCIHFETDEGDSTYLLATGKWFKIKTEFCSEINDFYTSIPLKDLAWIKYEHDSEGAYNKAVYDSNKAAYALMDAINIQVGGIRDKIEFCDIYTDAKELIHIKRYGGSSLLGHLFNQGLVSGEHLRMDESFQAKVNDKLPATHSLTLNDKTPRSVSDYAITFAIISEDQGSDLNIPFFAKVAFKHACSRLRSFGFSKISRSKILVNEDYSKKVKPKNKKVKGSLSSKKSVVVNQSRAPLVKASPLPSIVKKTIFKGAK